MTGTEAIIDMRMRKKTAPVVLHHRFEQDGADCGVQPTVVTWTTDEARKAGS